MSSFSDKDLQIDVKVGADTAGAKQTEIAIGRIGAAATEVNRETVNSSRQASSAVKSMGDAAQEAGHKTAHASNEASKEVKSLGHDFHAGAQAGRILAEVAEGNIGALAHLGSAIKTVGVLLKTNLIGTLFTLGAIAAQVILPMVHGFKSVEEQMKKTAEEAEKLAKTRMDSLTRELEVAGEEVDELRKKFERAQAAKERLDNAEEAARLAEVRNNTNLTEVDKAKAESAIKEEFRQRADQRKIESGENKIRDAKLLEKRAREAAVEPERDLQEATAERDELITRAREAPEKLKSAQEQLNKALENGENAEPIKAKIGELANTILKSKTPEYLASINDRIEKATKPVDTARKAIADAETQVRYSEEDLEAERTTQGGVNRRVQRERAADLKGALTTARAKDDERADTIRSAREKLNAHDEAKSRAETELRDLESQLGSRPGLSDDPRNRDLVTAIAKKKNDISAFDNQRSALEENLRTTTKDAPKSIVDRSISPALQGRARDEAASKENTAAIKELTTAISNLAKKVSSDAKTSTESSSGKSEASPGMMIVDGKAIPMNNSTGGGTIIIDGEVARMTPGAKPSAPTVQLAGDVKKPLDQALAEARAKDAAFVDFAKTSVSDSRAAKRQMELQQRQLANSR